MDWIKIRNQHVLDSELTDAEVGMLVRFQAKTAMLEAPLSNKEIKRTFSDKKYQKISEFLSKKYQICIKKISEKVLEDVEKYLKKSRKNHERVKRHREKLLQEQQNLSNSQELVTHYKTVTSNDDVTSLDKNRIDINNINSSYKGYNDITLMSSPHFLEILKNEEFLLDPIEYCANNTRFCFKIANLKADKAKDIRNRDGYIAVLIKGLQGNYQSDEIHGIIKQAGDIAQNEILEKRDAEILEQQKNERIAEDLRRSDEIRQRRNLWNSLPNEKKDEYLMKSLEFVNNEAPAMNVTKESGSVKINAECMAWSEHNAPQ